MKCKFLISFFAIIIFFTNYSFGQDANSTSNAQSVQIYTTQYDKQISALRIDFRLDFLNFDWSEFNNGFLKASYQLVSALRPDVVIYSTTLTSLFLLQTDFEGGKFYKDRRIDIPFDKLFSTDNAYILKAKIDIKGRKLEAHTKPFTLDEINQKLGKHKLQKPYRSIINVKATVKARGIDIQFNTRTNEKFTKYRVAFLDNNKDTIFVSAYSPIMEQQYGPEVFKSYFTEFFISKGKHHLDYKILIKSEFVEEYVAHSSSVSFVQPELYWLDFESYGADIDVTGMDIGAVSGLSVSSGKGWGDAFYQIRNKSDAIFTSDIAQNSGNISDTKGRAQTYLREPIILSFFDQDITLDDKLGSYQFSAQYPGKQLIQIKNKGRINAFNFRYELSPVNTLKGN